MSELHLDLNVIHCYTHFNIICCWSWILVFLNWYSASKQLSLSIIIISQHAAVLPPVSIPSSQWIVSPSPTIVALKSILRHELHQNGLHFIEIGSPVRQHDRIASIQLCQTDGRIVSLPLNQIGRGRRAPIPCRSEGRLWRISRVFRHLHESFLELDEQTLSTGYEGSQRLAEGHLQRPQSSHHAGVSLAIFIWRIPSKGPKSAKPFLNSARAILQSTSTTRADPEPLAWKQ